MLQMFLSNCTYARIFFPAQAALEVLRTVKNTTGHPENTESGAGFATAALKKTKQKNKMKVRVMSF